MGREKEVVRVKREYINPSVRHQVRLGFARYLHSRYAMPMPNAYYKLRHGRIKRWEAQGVLAMIQAFDPDYQGAPEEFYRSIDGRKKQFQKFVERTEWQMSPRTVQKRFSAFDFSEWELRGLDDIYVEFKAVPLGAILADKEQQP